MKTSLKHLKTQGFTIVEILIVIIVIGILASIVIISYNGVQKQAIDKGVASDIDAVSGEVTRYQVNHNGQLGPAVAWYSPAGTNANISFIPTKGNVIDVVSGATSYCVRAYNVSAKTYNSLATALSQGSDGTACASLGSSDAAYAADPSQTNFNTLTWTLRTSPGSRNWTSAASSADGAKLVVAGTGTYIYTSTDSGNSWTQQTGSGSRSWTSIASSSDGTKLAATSNGYIYTSTDSGVTWTSRASGQRWESIASSSDGTKLVAGTNNIYTSTDSGATWTLTSAPFVGTAWAGMGSSSDGSVIVSANTSGYIYTSNNAGLTWVQRSTTGSGAWGKVSVSSNGAKSIAYRQGGTIFKSLDSGASWTDTMAGVGYCNNGVAISADGRKMIASDGTGVIRSVDVGVTWTSSTLPNSGCWKGLASSADGIKVVAAMSYGYIATGVYTP